MTVSLFYPSEDGHVRNVATGGVYATAWAGGGTFTVNTTGDGTGFHPYGIAGPTNPGVYQDFWAFDTSSIPDGDVIDAVVLRLCHLVDNTATVTNVCQVRAHSWTAPIQNSTFVTGANLASKTLLATKTSGVGTRFPANVYTEWVSEPAFAGYINKTGLTQFMMCTDRMVAGTTPANDETIHPYFVERAGSYQDPELVVYHHTPGVVAPVRIEGFEHQTKSANSFGGHQTESIFSLVADAGNAITFDTTVKRTGTASLKVVEAAAEARVHIGVPSTTKLVGSLYLRAVAPPTVESRILWCAGAVADSRKFFIDTSGRILAGDSAKVTGPVITDGIWHRLDFRVDSSGATHTIEWQVDGVPQTTASENPGGGAGTIEHLRIGISAALNHNATFWVDDVLLSITHDDYPLGPHSVYAWVPDHDGTHVPGVNVIETNAGVDLTSGAGFGLVDEWPANTSDYIQQLVTGVTNYAEIAYPNLADPDLPVMGVSALAALFAAGANANLGVTRVYDGTAATLVILYDGDMSEAALHYRTRMVPPPNRSAWAADDLSGVRMRLGFGTVGAGNVPRWSALMLQYAVEGVAVTLDYIEGFEHRTLDVNKFGGAATTGLFDSITVPAAFSFVAGRTGGYALRSAASATGPQLARTFPASAGHRVVSLAFRVVSGNPSAATALFVMDQDGSGISFNVLTNGTIEARCAGGQPVGPVVTDGNWHRLDYYLNTSANPWVMKWSVDGVVQTDASGAATAATGGAILKLGQYASATATFDYDDVVASGTAADYPIGPHKVLAVVPTGDGTHSNAGGQMDNEAGIDIGVTPAWQELDEWPSTTAGYVAQVGNDTGAYAEVTFPNTTEATVLGAQALAAMFAENTTANNGTVRIVDADNVTRVDIYVGDMSETTLHYRTAVIPGVGTPQFLNGLKARMGFSSNATTDARWSALMIQYAVVEVAVTSPTATESGSVADTATVMAQLVASDSETGVDTATVTVPATAADSGIAADAVVSLNVALTRTDSGVGADVSSLLTPTQKSANETGSAADVAVRETNQRAASDVAVAADVAVLATTVLKTASDSATSSNANQTAVVTVPVIAPIVPTARFGEFAWAVQSGFGVPAGSPRWAVPLGMPDGQGVPEPEVEWTQHYPARGSVGMQEVRRDMVSWVSDITIPAFTRPLPTLLRGLLGTESLAGTVHTMQPASADTWMTFWSKRPGYYYERYLDGLVEGLRFDFSSGMPVNLGVQARGRTPTFLDAPYTATETADIRSGWLTYIGTEVRFDWSANPPTVLRWETESGQLYISRPSMVHPSYRVVNPTAVTRGPLAIELTVELVFREIDHYRQSVYGGLVSTPQGQTVYGSATMKFFERDAAGGRYMLVTLPAVSWDVGAPQPLSQSQSGHVLVQATGRAVVPASIGRSGHAITIAVDNGLVAAG